MSSNKKPAIMAIEGIPDWEKRLARVDAFWDRQILDRSVVCVYAPKNDPRYPQPVGQTYASQRDRWMDFEHLADRALADAMNREYLGDALPHTYPNLGPEIFNAYLGMELEFGEITSWSHPNLHEWSGLDAIAFDPANADWMPVYKRCQAAGKGLQMWLEPNEFDLFMEQLRPEGLFISTGVGSKEEGEALLRKVARWR